MQRHARRPASELRFMQAGADARGRSRSASAARCRRRSPSSARARSATSSPASRTSARPAPARRSPTAARRLDRGAAPATATPSRWCSAGLFPIDGDDFEDLRESLEKLKLNDASITYAPESSGALGFGFRCGFLGLLHMEIVKERLEREFDLGADRHRADRRVPGAPHRRRRSTSSTTRPTCPTPQRIDYIEEPYFKVDDHHADRLHRHADGAVPAAARRADKLEYLSPERVELHYLMPAGRGRRRLLRPAEVPQPGLRQPRLRAGRLPPLEPGQGRPPAQRRAGRRLLARSCTATRPTTTAGG